jgi:four helix bundle protein
MFPSCEQYGLSSQIRRAATSIPLNIAEGYGKRDSQAELKRYLRMSLGSANEVLVLLEFSKDMEYITEEMHEKAYTEYEEICKMLNTFIKRTN